MKRITLLILPVILLAGCHPARLNEADSLKRFNEIDSLLQRKEFFAARDKWIAQTDHLTNFHQLKAGAEIDNAFNRLQASDAKIETLFNDYGSKLTDKDKYHLLRIKQMNHSKLFEYQKAYDALHELTTNYRAANDGR